MSDDSALFVSPTDNVPMDSAPDEDSAPVVDDADEPRFSLREVQKLKKEAQAVRDDRRRAVEKAKAEASAAKDAEWAEKLSAHVSELEQAKAASDLEILKYRAVIEAEVPSELVLDLVSLVQGDDEETISESVAKLKSVMGHQVRDRAVDPMQGSGNAAPLNGDPLLARIKQIVGA